MAAFAHDGIENSNGGMNDEDIIDAINETNDEQNIENDIHSYFDE